MWKIMCWNRYAIHGVLPQYLIRYRKVFKSKSDTVVSVLLDFQVKTAGYEKCAKSWMPKRITKVPSTFFLLANKEALKILFPPQNSRRNSTGNSIFNKSVILTKLLTPNLQHDVPIREIRTFARYTWVFIYSFWGGIRLMMNTGSSFDFSKKPFEYCSICKRFRCA